MSEQRKKSKTNSTEQCDQLPGGAAGRPGITGYRRPLRVLRISQKGDSFRKTRSNRSIAPRKILQDELPRVTRAPAAREVARDPPGNPQQFVAGPPNRAGSGTHLQLPASPAAAQPSGPGPHSPCAGA